MSLDDSDCNEKLYPSLKKGYPNLDDTLLRRYPSQTYEKFLDEQADLHSSNEGNDKTCSDSSKLDAPVHIGDTQKSDLSSEAGQMHDYEPNTSEIHESVSNISFGNDTPIGKQTKYDPFASTPGTKTPKSQFLSLSSGMRQTAKDDQKTPSKIRLTGTTDQLDKSRIALFLRDEDSTKNPLEEFCALKEKAAQDQHNLLDLDAELHGDAAVVVDIRKQDYDTTYENSILDDDLVPVNLAPAPKDHRKKEASQPQSTQADGNIHEEVNDLIHQRLQQNPGNDTTNPFDDSYTGYHCASTKNVKGENNTTNSYEKGFHELDKNDILKDLENTNIGTAINGIPDTLRSKESQIIDLSQSNDKYTDTKGSSNRTQISNSQSQAIISTSPVTLRESIRLELPYPLVLTDLVAEASQNLNSDDSNRDEKGASVHNEVNESTQNLIDRTNIQATQAIDPLSQSMVIEDKNNDDVLIQYSGDFEEEYATGDDGDEDGEEIIKQTRRFLSTYRIDDYSQSQSQSQSQLHLQLQSQSQSQSQVTSDSPTQFHAKSSKQNYGSNHTEPNSSNKEHLTSQNAIDTSGLRGSDLDDDSQPIADTLRVNFDNSDNCTNKEAHTTSINNPSSPVVQIVEANSSLIIENEKDNGNENEKVDIASNLGSGTNRNTILEKEADDENVTGNILVPNTSSTSFSKLSIDTGKEGRPLKNDEETGGITSSTPLNNRKASGGLRDRGNDIRTYNRQNFVLEKLNNVLSDDGVESAAEIEDVIVREKPTQNYSINDILDEACIFYADGTSRVPGKIWEVIHDYDKDKEQEMLYFYVKDRDGKIHLPPTKIFAPICFDIGDKVKYKLDKSSSYEVSGLKKSATDDCLITTIDGFNKLLIQKRHKGEKIGDEIEVKIEDLYLTGPLANKYKYKLFNDVEKFATYVEYQINKFTKINGGHLNLEELNADDTLIKLLPETKQQSILKSRNNGPFNKCLFVITGLNDSAAGSKNSSTTNTPRNKRHYNINSGNNPNEIVEFIKSQGGTVYEDELIFEELIKFRNTNEDRGSTRSVYTSFLSPSRRSKQKRRNEDKATSDFKRFKCIQDLGQYYKCEFDNKDFKSYEDYIEIGNEIRNFEFGCVIGSRHCRKLKYLECLSLKWPIISIEFFKKCQADANFLSSWKDEWFKFLLISGENNLLNCPFSIDIFNFFLNWKNGLKLEGQLNNNLLFYNESIIIIGDPIDSLKTRSGNRIWGKKRTANGVHLGPKRKKGKQERGEGNNAPKNNSDANADPVMALDQGHGIVPNGIDEGATQTEDDEDEDEDEDEGEELARQANEASNNVIVDGPKRTESLLWIFKHLGFSKVFVLKEGSPVGDIIRKENIQLAYVKYGHSVNEFTSFLHTDNRNLQCVNWEWVVQHLVLGCK